MQLCLLRFDCAVDHKYVFILCAISQNSPSMALQRNYYSHYRADYNGNMSCDVGSRQAYVTHNVLTY